MEVGGALLGVFGGGGFGQFDFGGGVAFEGHAAAETGEDRRYFRRVFR